MPQSPRLGPGMAPAVESDHELGFPEKGAFLKKIPRQLTRLIEMRNIKPDGIH